MIVDLIHDEVATKADVAAVKADVALVSTDLRRIEISLKADIAAVRADLALVEDRLLTRLGGLVVVTLLASSVGSSASFQSDMGGR